MPFQRWPNNVYCVKYARENNFLMNVCKFLLLLLLVLSLNIIVVVVVAAVIVMAVTVFELCFSIFLLSLFYFIRFAYNFGFFLGCFTDYLVN